MGFLEKDVSPREERIGDSLNKYLLRAYYVPGTVPGTALYKTGQVPALMKLIMEGQDWPKPEETAPGLPLRRT